MDASLIQTKFNPLIPNVMSQIIRSYRISKDVLYCTVDVLPDGPDCQFIDENHWTATGPEYSHVRLSMIVGPGSDRSDDLKVNSTNCSRSFLLSEIEHFLTTVKTMYQL